MSQNRMSCQFGPLAREVINRVKLGLVCEPEFGYGHDQLRMRLKIFYVWEEWDAFTQISKLIIRSASTRIGDLCPVPKDLVGK